ncbi:LOW QUALITY PROTEIN: Reverse transcriptase [Phytophthora palmivora]|uniref:Reverse transcriptase n=1 Tax=Phytophthora palmivora TaxID=4796 RepID=A0A2P4XWB4_9STRA|nr:LOW QUALITY PROTEIN: Reverse transcriptase [Phytophthora palmivora]
MHASVWRPYTKAMGDAEMPGIVANSHKNGPVGAGYPTGNGVSRGYNGHARMKTAAYCKRASDCKIQDEKSNLVILKAMTKSKRAGSLRGLVDSDASINFGRQQGLPLLDFEEVGSSTGNGCRRENVIRSRFSYKYRVFMEDFIVPELDDKFDMVLGMPWRTRHTSDRLGKTCDCSDGLVGVAHAAQWRIRTSSKANSSRPCLRSGQTLRIRTNQIRREAPLQSVEVTQTRYQHRVGIPPKGVEVTTMRRLRESTLQVVRTVANVQHRINLRAVVQPGCMKRNALKPALMIRARVIK